jgi:polyisoprenoid-binding protein YceI
VAAAAIVKRSPVRPWIGSALLAFAACFAPPAAAQQRLLPAQSEIAFTSRQMGVPVQGRFRSFEAQVEFDPNRPEAARIVLRIVLASAAIGTAETETELATPGWFDSARFPQASFVSTRVSAASPGRFEVAGKLTLKGVTRELGVPVTLVRSGDITTASGSFAIRRLDYRVGEGEWSDTSLVADEVQVRFKLALAGVP